MATYYKYAERQADSFVNWAEIGKGITDMISTETKIREEKKAAIDEASRKLGEQLSNAPSGEHQGMNSWTLNYANDAQQARLIQDRLLKSGQLNLKDYTIMRQNINDGTTQLFNLAKEYQEEYKAKMERLKSNDPNAKSQDLEAFFMETVEGFANFTKSKAVINPTNFQVSIGLMKKNPETGVMELSDEFATVSDLRNRIKGRFDYFNSRAASETVASGFAKFIDSEIEQGKLMGKVITVQDAMKRKGFTDSLDDAINSQIANPYNVTSILTNDIKVDEKGQQYTFTFNEKEAGGNVIYLKMDELSGMPKPVFTKEQEDAAKSFLKGQILQRIEYEKQIKPFSVQQPQQPSEASINRNLEEKSKNESVTLWMDIYSARTADQKAAAKAALIGSPYAIQQGLVDIKFSPDGETVDFIFSDPVRNRKGLSLKDSAGNPIPPESWAAIGTEIHGVADKTRLGNLSSGRQFSETDNWSDIKGGRTGSNSNASQAQSYIESRITQDMFRGKKTQDIAPMLTQILRGTGFSVQDVGGTTGNDIKITSPSGESIEVNTNSYTEGGASTEYSNLISFIRANTTEGVANQMINAGIDLKGTGELD